MERIVSYTTKPHVDEGINRIVTVFKEHAPASMDDAALQLRARQVLTLYERGMNRPKEKKKRWRPEEEKKAA